MTAEPPPQKKPASTLMCQECIQPYEFRDKPCRHGLLTSKLFMPGEDDDDEEERELQYAEYEESLADDYDDMPCWQVPEDSDEMTQFEDSDEL